MTASSPARLVARARSFLRRRAPAAARRAHRDIAGVLRTIDRRNLSLTAAGIAFYSLFSVFPGLAALVAVFGLFADPQVVAEQVTVLRDLMPDGAYRLLERQVDNVLATRTGALGWATGLSVGVSLWSARRAIAGLTRALDEVFERPPRPGLRRLGVDILLTGSIILAAVVGLLLVVVLPLALSLLPVDVTTARLAGAVRWLALLAMQLFTLGLLYRFGPNRRGQRLDWLTPGTIVALALWLTASYVFSSYLARFGTYNEVYGSLGAVVALLMWFYLTALSVLVGAVVNRQREIR